jgi:hypothetical protein
MDQLWHTIEEARDNYFVSYSPAGKHSYLAIVTLTYQSEIPSNKKIAEAVERELRHWMARFNVPIMATARNATRDAIEFGEEFRDGFLFGHTKENDEIELHWGPSSDESIPDDMKTPEYRSEEYKDIPYTSRSKIIEGQKQHNKIIQTGKALVLIWVVVIPAIFVVVGYYDWFLVGLIAMLYCLMKGLVETLRIGGYLKESKRKKEKREEELEKDHHNYHCKKNPEGFARLKAENFKREDEIEALKKFDTIKNNKA